MLIVKRDLRIVDDTRDTASFAHKRKVDEFLLDKVMIDFIHMKQIVDLIYISVCHFINILMSFWQVIKQISFINCRVI